jgi:hypothetical protein
MRYLEGLRSGTRALFEHLWRDFGIQNHAPEKTMAGTECSSAESAGQVADQGSPAIQDAMNITYF